MYVRWLGCFRKVGTLQDALTFELTRDSVVACEHFKKKSNVKNKARVGLLVSPDAVYKHFDGDVFSEYTDNGTLYKNRQGYQAFSKHIECWAKPVYTGIVIRDGSLNTLSFNARLDIIETAKRYDLLIYRLSKGQLVKEVVK